MAKAKKSLDDAIAEVVKARLDASVIDHIEVEADDDSDGEPILRITVVFSKGIESLDSHRLAGLARYVRPELAEQGNTRFPIFRFISKRDFERQNRAAA